MQLKKTEVHHKTRNKSKQPKKKNRQSLSIDANTKVSDKQLNKMQLSS